MQRKIGVHMIDRCEIERETPRVVVPYGIIDPTRDTHGVTRGISVLARSAYSRAPKRTNIYARIRAYHIDKQSIHPPRSDGRPTTGTRR